MPTGSGYAHLFSVSGESDRLGIGAGFAQSQDVVLLRMRNLLSPRVVLGFHLWPPGLRMFL